MTEYNYEIKIPKERIAVLIGKQGETKKLIEQETKTKLNIDSQEGDVTVSGEDALTLYSTRDIITAIGRGFNPKIALNLIKVDYSFDLINLGDIARSKSDLLRLKGRVIGQEGKSRKIIEEMTDCEICIYGKTAGIIGPADKSPIARRAIEMLLGGSMHSSVYKYLEKQRRDLRMQDLSSGKGL